MKLFKTLKIIIKTTKLKGWNPFYSPSFHLGYDIARGIAKGLEDAGVNDE